MCSESSVKVSGIVLAGGGSARLGQDKALVEALHRGSGSPLLPLGTYHPIERNLWQFMRYLARRCQP